MEYNNHHHHQSMFIIIKTLRREMPSGLDTTALTEANAKLIIVVKGMNFPLNQQVNEGSQVIS